MKNKIKNWEKELEEKVLKHELGGKEDFCYDKKEIESFIRQEKTKERQKLLKEIEKALQDFRIGVKRLEDTKSPIQILDTSKNFFIQKIKPLLDTL